MYSMIYNLELEKDKIREKLLSERHKLRKSDVSGKSKSIYKRLVNFSEIKTSKKILVYLPINNEVDTENVIKFLIKNKKLIFIPAFNNNKWMISEFNDFDNLQKGPYGILQPVYKSRVESKVIDVAIIPGVAFSKNGVRLGYGKGVYDRLLKNFKGIRIGLAYDFQIIDDLPKVKHDLVMDIVITDNKIYDFEKADTG